MSVKCKYCGCEDGTDHRCLYYYQRQYVDELRDRVDELEGVLAGIRICLSANGEHEHACELIGKILGKSII